jgi:hypothetical protein
MTIIQFFVDGQVFVKSLPQFSYLGPAFTEAQRLDYSSCFLPNCPDDVAGKGEAVEEVIPPTLGDDEILLPVANEHRAAGRLVDGKWRVQQAKRTLTPEEIAEAFDIKKQNKLAELSSEFSVRRNSGVTVSGHLFATTNDGHQELKALKDRLDRVGGTQKAVTRAGDMIEADATQATAIFIAVDDYIAACWSREYDLRVAINAAANATELKAIDITSGWPVSEQPK